MTLVRCFMMSVVLIKALDCLVPSEAAHPTVEEIPSNSPIHPTSIVNSSYDTKPNLSEDNEYSFAQEIMPSAGLCFVLTSGAILYAYLSYINTKQTSTVLKKPNHQTSIALISSVKTMVLSLICGVALARIPIDQNAIVSSCNVFSSWYMQNLEENPLVTKCLTSSVFVWLADLLAQSFEEMMHSDKSFLQNYNRRRGCAFLLDGIILSGPLLHYAFDLMESMFPTEGEDGSIMSSIIHVFLTDYFIDTIYIFLSFILVAMVEGEVHDVKKILKKNLWSTVKASWCTSIVLVPIEFVCFRYLAVGYRVLGMNMIDIIWQSVVSFFAHRGRKTIHQEHVDGEIEKAASIVSTITG